MIIWNWLTDGLSPEDKGVVKGILYSTCVVTAAIIVCCLFKLI